MLEVRRPVGGGWKVLGYHQTIESLGRAALHAGVTGNSVAELLVSVESAEHRVMAALRDAIGNGSLSEVAFTGRGRANRKQNSAATESYAQRSE